jgi:PAS domain-containing protein
MMRKALTMSDYVVMDYHVQSNRFVNLHGSMLPADGLTLSEFIERVHPNDQTTVKHALEQLVSGKRDVWHSDYRWNAATTETPQWIFIQGHTIAEKAEDGNTTEVLCTVKDVTKESEQDRKDSDLANKYIQLFEATLVGMAFYDKNGTLIDLNENMRTLCLPLSFEALVSLEASD